MNGQKMKGKKRMRQSKMKIVLPFFCDEQWNGTGKFV